MMIENSSHFKRVATIEKIKKEETEEIEENEEITKTKIQDMLTPKKKLRNLVLISVSLDLQDSKMTERRKKIKRNQRSSKSNNNLMINISQCRMTRKIQNRYTLMEMLQMMKVKIKIIK